MAVTILAPGRSARCQAGPLTLEWHVDGGPSSSVALSVEPEQGSHGPAVPVQPLSPGQLLLPLVREPVVVVARPAHGYVFGDGVTLDLTVRLSGGITEYVLHTIDLSGISEARLVAAAPNDGALVLVAEPASAPAPPPRPARGEQQPRFDSGEPTTSPEGPVPPSPPTTQPSGGSTARETLPPSALRAAYSARRRIDSARLPPEQLSQLIVAVDRSASMLSVVRTGALADLLEILLGLSTVVSAEPVLPVWELGQVPSLLPRALSPTTVDGFVGRELQESASTTGTLVRPLVSHLGHTDVRQRVVVVTDGPPPDGVAFAESVAAARVAGSATSWHLVAFARSLSDPSVAAEPWLDELARLPGDAWASVASLTPGVGPSWLSERMSNSAELNRLVNDIFDWAPAGVGNRRF